MNGIAIIIPNADFSGSPLGKVTKVKTASERAEEIVTLYSNAIGISSYNAELIEMVTSLINAGAWEGLDIYPILGSNLNTQLVNLNPSGFFNTSLVVAPSAVASDNVITFTKIPGQNPSDATFPDGRISKNIKVLNESGFFNAMDIIRNTDVSGNSYIKYSTGYEINSSSDMAKIKVKIYSSRGEAVSSVDSSKRHFWGISHDTNKISIYVDGEKDVEQSLTSSPNAEEMFTVTNDIGLTFNGDVRFYCQGYIDQSTHATVIEIFKRFLDKVKPNI